MKYSLRIALAVGIIALANQAWAQEKFETYTVKPGDTCTSIAAKFYGDARAYNHIHEYNDLSQYGYACRPGLTLRLPILADQPEAQLLARAGSVRAKPPEAAWDPVDVGAELFTAWRVNTLEKSRAELGFRDSSQLQMTQNTLVVIYGPSKTSSQKTTMRRATVERGRLKTRLAGLSGQNFEVDTPEAKAVFEKGRAQVTVDEDESRIANHEGKPVEVTDPAGKGRVRVKAGQGTRIRRGKRPEKPRPLPAAPKWAPEFSPRALTIPGARATVRAQWQPVRGAKAYYVEVTRTRRQLDVLFSGRVPDHIHALEMRELPAGNYYVSVVAIDGAEFESIPSKMRRLRVLELGINEADVLDADAGRVLLGSLVRAPEGLQCVVGDKPAAGVFRLDNEGPGEIRCEGENTSVSTAIEVVKPTLNMVSAEAVEIPRGSLEAVEIEFSPALPPEVSAQVSGQGVHARTVRVDAGRLRVQLVAGRDAPLGATTVDLLYKGVPLGGFEATVKPAGSAKSSKAAGIGPQGEYLLSVLLGYDAGGVDAYWGQGLPSHGGAVEVGLGTAPTQYFAAEARAGLIFYPAKSAEGMFTLRAQALAGWFNMALAPHAGLGLSWQMRFASDDRFFSPRASLGVMPALNDQWRLRAEIAVDATPIDGTIRFLPEARVGAAWRF